MAQQSPAAQMYEAEWQLDGKGIVRLYIQAANEADVLTEAEDFFTRLLAHPYPRIAPAGQDVKATEPGNAVPEAADTEHAQAREHAAEANDQVTPSASNPNANESSNGRVAPADERLARKTKRVSKPEPVAAQESSPVPDRPSTSGRPALRGLIGLIFATSIFVAAFISHLSPIDADRLTVRRAAIDLTSSEPLDQLEHRLPRGVSAAQPNAAGSIASQPMHSSQTASQEVAATASLSLDQAQMLQVITRDLAKLGQQIEELNSRQQWMVGENAKAIEHLTASQDQLARENIKAIQQLERTQEQVARDNAKTAEQNQQPKALKPDPIANSKH
jgi:hypothetical protein